MSVKQANKVEFRSLLAVKAKKQEDNNDDGGDDEKNKTEDWDVIIEEENILVSLVHVGTIRKCGFIDAEFFPTAIPKRFG